MIQYVIIADDLTGANASGSLTRKMGLKTMTIMGSEMSYNFNSQVITYSTDSRAIDKNEAYQKVYDATKRLVNKHIKLVNKRIDSTLRGNVGAEIDGMMDALNNGTMAYVVPIFPSSGRICVGGYLLVNGIPLELTPAAKDPKAPIATSKVEDIIKIQTKNKIGVVDLSTIIKGVKAIKNDILTQYKNGTKIIIFDAITQEDINTIAQAVKLAEIPFFSVDPGPFTTAVIQQDIKNNKKSYKENILMTVGSVTPVTKSQLELMSNENDVFLYSINAEKLLGDIKTRNNIIDKCVDDVLSKMENYTVVCITTIQFDKSYKLDLIKVAKQKQTSVDELSNIINDTLAEITCLILQKNSCCNALFSSGGDVTVSICKKLNIDGLELEDEVIPLAVYGVLKGGKSNNIKIITKGGLIGDENGIKICIDYLKNIKEKIYNE